MHYKAIYFIPHYYKYYMYYVNKDNYDYKQKLTKK